MNDTERMLIMFFPEENIQGGNMIFNIDDTAIYVNKGNTCSLYYTRDNKHRYAVYGKRILELCKFLPTVTTITTRRELQ